MSIRAAWINLETGIVDNIIVADESDLARPMIKEIPSRLNSNNDEEFLPVVAEETKWIDQKGFCDLEGNPLQFSPDPVNLNTPTGTA